mmetsp:Transcript_23163/g.20064  ORF Transcript_23163/g.20064 Transcript_23163/m.20064 type:complete len:413 (+) Transcript_23163:154-1392(+)|eukprot:CAMPEP_0114587942 /NCGR_PEP_ID=MMETSP0125-20121206/10773_1 /TAXON_ID=485358 ORGANISM="Aristerostoma sp., Strain ATCC 50986" /NCGR_SAMPLE_ID=MMETSP0125 /ASSEMBLY_ACC=CAM_ASM_000245 /LENGTH=412 /DNA_ID=CAMNT_0001784099 /DNA_START=51 /DNA_END=1289 /DNA_ORIENTATION=-
MVGCLLFSYPAGFFYKRIDSVALRHFISIALGFFYQYMIYKEETLHVFILSLICYVLLKVLKRKAAKPTFILSMTYLVLMHARAMYNDYGGWRMIVTGTLMICICKITAVAWCYRDGGKTDDKLSPEQIKNKLEEVPSIIEYFSYILFYATSLVGPFCEYKDFIDMIHKRGNYALRPHTFFPSLKYLLSAFVFLGIVITLAPHYAPAYLITDEFGASNLGYKFYFVFMSMLFHRCRYYTAWSIANANVTTSGLNYDHESKEDKFKKIVAVLPYDFEFKADNVRDKLEYWNTSCQQWLKYYIYLRICPANQIKAKPAKATLASNLTFMASALWHGLYPGYYLGFFMLFITQQLNKFVFRVRSKFQFIPEVARSVIGNLLSTLLIDFAAVPFSLLDFTNAMTFLSNMFYIPVVG